MATFSRYLSKKKYSFRDFLQPLASIPLSFGITMLIAGKGFIGWVVFGVLLLVYVPALVIFFEGK